MCPEGSWLEMPENRDLDSLWMPLPPSPHGQSGGFVPRTRLLLRAHSLWFFFFRAAPMAYGSSQPRGQIGVVAAGLHHSHSNARSEPHLQPIAQLMAT